MPDFGRHEHEPSTPWIVGWGVGGLVVAIAASLLVAIIGLGRRIVRQASEIESALDGAREHTTALFAVSETNATIERTTAHLRTLRERMDQG